MLVVRGKDEPAAVGQEVVLPALHFMCPANGVEDLLTRLEPEMVGVVQT